MYAQWKSRNVVIGFKYDISGLMKDFSDGRKMFDEIDAVIVWEITEADRRDVERRGISLGEIEKASFHGRERFPNATSEMYIENVKPILLLN